METFVFSQINQISRFIYHDKGKALSILVKETFIEEIITSISLMEKATISGPIRTNILVIFFQELDRVEDNGLAPKENLTKENFMKIKKMGMEFTNGIMAIIMKDNSKRMKEMGKEKW